MYPIPGVLRRSENRIYGILYQNRECISVGSSNFNPRSFALNRQMGVLIESQRLAGGLARAFAEMFSVATYRPVPRVDKTLFREEITPGATMLSRLLLFLVGALPIEWLR